MNNLVEQASQWLQSEACRSGNILERTIAVIACFRKYVVEEKTEICDNTGLSLSTIMGRIDQTESTIRQILSAFLRGNQQDALQKTHKMMQTMKFAVLSPGFPMYKCRENAKLFHFTKDYPMTNVILWAIRDTAYLGCRACTWVAHRIFAGRNWAERISVQQTTVATH